MVVLATHSIDMALTSQDIEKEVVLLKQDMISALEVLNNLTDGNHEESMSHFSVLVKSISDRGDALKAAVPNDELKKYHPDLKKYTKEIQRKLDNIVEEKNDELKLISSKLNAINNQKKLSQYFG